MYNLKCVVIKGSKESTTTLYVFLTFWRVSKMMQLFLVFYNIFKLSHSFTSSSHFNLSNDVIQ